MFSDSMFEKDIRPIADALWKDQSKQNWEAFGTSLKKSGLKYYRIVFEAGKLEKQDDLRTSYAELYDAKEKLVAKIPIFMTDGANVEGATIYLKGLLNLNR